MSNRYVIGQRHGERSFYTRLPITPLSADLISRWRDDLRKNEDGRKNTDSLTKGTNSSAPSWMRLSLSKKLTAISPPRLKACASPRNGCKPPLSTSINSPRH